MKRHQSFIEPRPFRSEAERLREQTLEAKYRRIAIPELADLMQQQQQASGTPSTRKDDDAQLH